MWEIQSNPHLRIGPKWYTVAVFGSKKDANAYLEEHRDRLVLEEGTEDFRVEFSDED